jgi:hypothetical protein
MAIARFTRSFSNSRLGKPVRKSCWAECVNAGFTVAEISFGLLVFGDVHVDTDDASYIRVLVQNRSLNHRDVSERTIAHQDAKFR